MNKALRVPDYLEHILQAIEVDLEVVWKTIHADLPELYSRVKECLQGLQTQ